MKNNLKRLTITVNGTNVTVDRTKYAEVKLKQLREFGYNDLTMQEVESEIDMVLNKKELTVIGIFMQDEIVEQQP